MIAQKISNAKRPYECKSDTGPLYRSTGLAYRGGAWLTKLTTTTAITHRSNTSRDTYVVKIRFHLHGYSERMMHEAKQRTHRIEENQDK